MIHCVVCSTEKHPREAEHGLLCHGDSNRILRHLRELEEYLPTLVLLKPAVGITEYTSSQFGSRSPANDAVIAHADSRSDVTAYDKEEGRYWLACGCYVGDPCEHGRDLSALGVVRSWAAIVVEERCVKPAPSAFLDISLLRRNHDWIVHQPWVDEYASELRQVHAAVRVLAHDPVPRPVGRCIALDRRGDDCGGDVFELDDASGVKCSKCNRIYTGLDLDRLRVAQDRETA